MPWAIWLMDGPFVFGFLVAASLMGIAGALGVIFYPRIALMALFAMTLIFEHYAVAFPVSTLMPVFYDNLNVTLGIGPAKTNPIELVLVLIVFGWALYALSRPRQSLRIQTISLIGMCYGGWMAVAVLWGLVNHGNWKVALWILRPAFYFLSFSFLTFQCFRTPRHVVWAIGILVAMVLIKSFQIIWRHSFSGIPSGSVEAYASHEDTSFALWAAWFTLSGFFLRHPRRIQGLLWALLPVIMLGILWNDRRINIATFGVGCAIMLILQSKDAIRRRSRWLLAGAAFGFLYFVGGWFGPENPITSPVKGIKQGIRAEIYGENTDPSSWYRKVERYNLRQTIRANPILGTGLGVPYMQLIKLDKLSFGYSVYITHNQVLLVHSATGSIGYFIFLFFYSALMAQLTNYWWKLQVPWHRSVALVALLSVMNWLMVGYYDMQMFFFRNSIFMGFAVAFPAVLYRWELEQGMIGQPEARIVKSAGDADQAGDANGMGSANDGIPQGGAGDASPSCAGA